MSEHTHNHEHAHEHKTSCTCHSHNHEHKHSHDHEHEHGTSKVALVLAAVFFVLALVAEHASLPFEPRFLHYAVVIFCLISYFQCGKNVLIHAIHGILNGEVFDETVLMSVASVGAICTKQLPEAVAIMLFFQIGELFEDYASEKSENAVRSLLELCPETAHVKRGCTVTDIPAKEIVPGDIVLVKPGERIPVDGTVQSGSSFIDTSALTGESVPQRVTVGSEVFSGSVNKDSAIELCAVRPAEDSAASRILHLVHDASEKKTRTERFITRFSRVYTPLVFALAVLIAVVPPCVQIFMGNVPNWSVWISRALMLLVVSCPCAIVLSVPLSFFGAIGAAGKIGILLKGSANIESLAHAYTVAFDKTGTLTEGVFEVSEIVVANGAGLSKDELLSLAAHAEQYSNHPVALSLRALHSCPKCSSVKLELFSEIAGQGISVRVDESEIFAGNALLMQNRTVSGFSLSDEETLGGSIVHIAKNGQYAGYIRISDRIKQDSVRAVKDLRKAGVKNIVMLTGDKALSAQKTAESLGITEVYAELLPEDKLKKVEEYIDSVNGKKCRKTVVFAGDGINDAPVLSRADTGIAMGALGSDAAIESADVVIMTDEPSKIAEAIRISKKTLGIVYQNISVSLGAKLLIILLSAFGITGMWIAVFGDVGILILAVLNSMRTLRLR